MARSATPDRLVHAGLDLLVEGGWSRLTSRAVAERAGANVGLIHYHFGGMPQLRLAVTVAAVDRLVGPLHRDLLATPDLAAMLEVLATAFDDASRSPAVATLTAVLLDGAAREPALADALRAALRDARTELTTRLAAEHPDWSAARSAGVATLFVAATDGLLLHASVDDSVPTAAALDALGELLGAGLPDPEVTR